MLKIVSVALAVVAILAAIFGRIAFTEHAAAVTARAAVTALKAGDHANEAGLNERDLGAQEREIRYVQVIREVAAAGPVSPDCRRDPAMVAAGAGVLSMRDAYCREHPDRCASAPMPSEGHRSAGD